MTIPRYLKLKAQWQVSPPTHVMTLRIAQMLGYELPKASSGPAIAQTEERGDVFYDESYYPNTPKTPHKAEAFTALATDFAAAGGVVT
jgi:hypothetical protein